MIDAIYKTAMFAGTAGAVYLITYGIFAAADRAARKKRDKLKARAERYEAIEQLRLRATYHEWCLRKKLIAEGRYIVVRGRNIES